MTDPLLTQRKSLDLCPGAYRSPERITKMTSESRHAVPERGLCRECGREFSLNGSGVGIEIRCHKATETVPGV